MSRWMSPRSVTLTGLVLTALLAPTAGCSRRSLRVLEREAQAVTPSSADAAPSIAPSTAPSIAPSASPASPARAPAASTDLNVLLITVDSLRADMPWQGYARPIAPALTAFAETAVVYDRFYAISSYTAMSLGGMLAGRYPSELDRSGHYFTHYGEAALFFPALLQRAGVRTFSAQSHFYLDARSGFPRVFDAYRMVPGIEEDHQTDNSVTSPAQLTLALELLADRANTAGRFFAWFHFLDPHDQYQPHAGIDYGPAPRDRYDGEVTFTDQHLGKLLDFVAAQPWGARTAVVISADHGEAFGEHGRSRHGFELWDEMTHVPLMIRAPGLAPRHIATPRSAIDLAPTVLELFGLPPGPDMEGTSLVAELRGAPPEARDVILDLPRTTNSDRRRALIRGDDKLLAFGDDEAFMLFDLGKDPGEQREGRGATPAKRRAMKAAYEAWGRKIPSVCPKGADKLQGKKSHRPC